MKRRILPVILIIAALSGCGSTAEQRAETSAEAAAPIVYETMVAPLTAEEEIISGLIASGGIEAKEEAVLRERRRVALEWGQASLARWLESNMGQRICTTEQPPEITAVSADGRVIAIYGDKELCFKSEEDNSLRFVGYAEGFMEEDENLLAKGEKEE